MSIEFTQKDCPGTLHMVSSLEEVRQIAKKSGTQLKEALKGESKMNIKDIVKNNSVYFLYYRQQTMYYGVTVGEQKMMFPVPLEDVMDATLFAKEKAITYMRYIRKAINDGTYVPQN